MWLVSLVGVLSLCSCCLLRGLLGGLVKFGLDALGLRWFTVWFYWFGARLGFGLCGWLRVWVACG